MMPIKQINNDHNLSIHIKFGGPGRFIIIEIKIKVKIKHQVPLFPGFYDLNLSDKAR
jgi:hypothetical protein